MPRRLAVAASAQFPDLRPDWPLLRAALADRGVTARTQVWNDPDAEWDSLDLVVANGAWDNIHHADAFLAWAEATAARTRLVNTPETLRWNMDKRYLATLQDAGIPIVPTTYIATNDEVGAASLPDVEFVIKPSVSGGGFQTARYSTSDEEYAAARTHLSQLFAAGLTAMVQPYQSAVDREAETGLIFIGGTYSHAIRKGALLPPGTRAGANLHNDEVISLTKATRTQRRAAAGALEAAAALLGPTTYARVDLVPADDGTPTLLELELLDPALFFEHYPAGVARFADLLTALIAT